MSKQGFLPASALRVEIGQVETIGSDYTPLTEKQDAALRALALTCLDRKPDKLTVDIVIISESSLHEDPQGEARNILQDEVPWLRAVVVDVSGLPPSYHRHFVDPRINVDEVKIVRAVVTGPNRIFNRYIPVGKGK